MDIYRVDYGYTGGESPQKTRQKNDFSEILKKNEASQQIPKPQIQQGKPEVVSPPSTETAKEPALVSLGKVTRRNANVSSLLLKHSNYKKDCWRIIHSDINRDKPFTRIRSGTEIFLDPKTKEIVWGKMLEARKESTALAKSQPLQTPEEPKIVESSVKAEKEPKAPESIASISERLLGAVEPYLGKTYREMDCYEFLVKGLMDMGYRYRGKDGLSRKLMAMARQKGLPKYACFNGEGIIEASGTPVYSKALFKVRSPEVEAKQLLEEMEPHLERGQILAFSTHTKGHTGIVSRKQDAWSYINSGKMDNALESNGRPRGVGEESLEAEILDWLNMAKSRGESLRITLGRLNEKKLVAYADQTPSKSKKV